MPQQNLSQTRVQDPILTQFAHGWIHPDRVGLYLFPAVYVALSGGTVIEFDRSSFRKQNLRRAPGAHTRRGTFGYEGKPYSLVEDSYEVPLDRRYLRDAKQMPGIDLGRTATRKIMDNVTLQLEIEQADVARNPNNYGANNKVALAGADQFSDPACDVPVKIDEYREAVRSAIGVYPNVIINSATGHKATKNNPSVVDRFKYTSADSVTEAMLAQLFNVEQYKVGVAIHDDEDGATQDTWGNDLILAYVPPDAARVQTATFAPSGQIDLETPSYGYTYTMEGHPMIEEPYYEQQSKSWVYGGTYERQAVLTGMGAGFLVQNVA